MSASTYHFANDVVDNSDAAPINAGVNAHVPHPIQPAQIAHLIPFGVTVGVMINSPPFKIIISDFYQRSRFLYYGNFLPIVINLHVLAFHYYSITDIDWNTLSLTNLANLGLVFQQVSLPF